MADIIDEVEEEVIEVPAADVAEEVKVEANLEKELTPIKEPVAEVEAEAEVEDDLPEKYKGKSAKDIAVMHQQAEKLIGKQGSEVGELRKVVDDFISTQTSKASQTTEAPVTTEEFYDNPTQNVDKRIDSHPAIQEAQKAAKDMKRTATLTRLNAEYPDLENIYYKVIEELTKTPITVKVDKSIIEEGTVKPVNNPNLTRSIVVNIETNK